ncbi:hypothetical protein Tco_1249866 [Tanacetum coccineum]
MEEEDALLAFQHEYGVCADTPILEDGGDDPTVGQVKKRNKWDNDDYVYRGLILKGHGEADVILGIRIKHGSNGIAISQSYYIKKVLKKSNYFDCTPVSTPMDISEKLMPNNGQDVSQLEYSRVIGCLMYVMTCTKLDIAFVVGKLSSVATLAKAYSQIYNGKSRHLSVRHSMIRVLITNGMVSIEFVRSRQNLADHLTNGLDRDLVIKSAKGMRLKSN